MLKRVLIKYIIHQYRVLLEMHDTLSHINLFLHPINLITLPVITHWKRLMHLEDSV